MPRRRKSDADSGEPRVLLLITSCQAFADKCEAVRRTWLLDLPALKGCSALFVVGRPGQPTAVEGDILFVDAEDTYQALPLKVIRAMGWVHAHLDPDFVFKCDDDSFVCLPRLMASSFREHDYYGLDFREFLFTLLPSYLPVPVKRFVFSWFHPVPFAQGGAGYMLSRRALRAVCSCRATFLVCASPSASDVHDARGVVREL